MKNKSDIAVSVRGLSKSYSIAHNAVKHTTAGEALMHKMRNPFAREQRETFWALNDVNFDIQRGDVVGIIGRNGTGRENVFLNGAIRGMSKSEIAKQFDAIVDFSDTEQFLDTPVKRYSSGMYVRLAFAVAAHLNPEILIVDEVLAVGDAEFQKKCLGKMQDVAKSGRTVLFVSHNIQAVKSLCNRVLYLQKGEVIANCEMEAGLKQYLAGNNTIASKYVWEDADSQPGDDLLKLRAIKVLDNKSRSATTFYSSLPIHLEFEFDLTSVHESLCIGYDLTRDDGTCAFRSFHTDLNENVRPSLHPGLNRLSCTLPANLLNAGRYSVNVRIGLHHIKWITSLDDVVNFDVLFDHGESEFLLSGTRPGSISPVLQWSKDLDK
jgi:lipopolysaccharide transport system ATP-binding protein